jgi:hypothetical protein
MHIDNYIKAQLVIDFILALSAPNSCRKPITCIGAGSSLYQSLQSVIDPLINRIQIFASTMLPFGFGSHLFRHRRVRISYADDQRSSCPSPAPPGRGTLGDVIKTESGTVRDQINRGR